MNCRTYFNNYKNIEKMHKLEIIKVLKMRISGNISS